MAKYNLTVQQGATFEFQFEWLDESNQIIDLSYYDIISQFRYKSTNDLMFEASTANGRIYVDPTNRAFVTIPATVTELLTPTGVACGIYDVELHNTQDGKVYRILEGSVTVTREVTI